MLEIRRKYSDGYTIIENGITIFSICKSVFDMLFVLNRVPNEDERLKINSVKFVGLRKAGKKSKAPFFLIKDAFIGQEFVIFNENPIEIWSKEKRVFGSGGYVGSINKNIFERLTGIRKQAILKIGDIYGFKRINITVK